MKARFKAGRQPFDGETYNLVVASREEERQDGSGADTLMLKTLDAMLKLLGQMV